MCAQEFTGWLLDVYDDQKDGAVLWVLDQEGAPHRLCHAFPITFYVAGPDQQLRALWRFLQEQPTPVELDRQERRDLFCQEPVTVLCVRVLQPALQPRLFQEAARRFPALSFYDADLAFSLRYAAVHDTCPMAHCQVIADGEQLQSICVLDTPWDLDPPTPPFKVLSLELDSNPAHAPPTCLVIRTDLDNPRPASAHGG